MVCTVAWQKPTQHCKPMSLPLKRKGRMQSNSIAAKFKKLQCDFCSFLQLKKQLIRIMGYYSTIMKIRATTGLTLKCKWEVKAARLRRLQNYIHVFFCKRGNVGAENSLIPRGQKGEERRQLTTEEWGASWGVKVLVAQSRPTHVHRL